MQQSPQDTRDELDKLKVMMAQMAQMQAQQMFAPVAVPVAQPVNPQMQSQGYINNNYAAAQKADADASATFQQQLDSLMNQLDALKSSQSSHNVLAQNKSKDSGFN